MGNRGVSCETLNHLFGLVSLSSKVHLSISVAKRQSQEVKYSGLYW